MPFFSVIIPVYQSAHVVRDALESAFSQTFGDVEVIACDDGSTDNPDRVFQLYPRLRVVRQANKGLPGARNAAVAEATGDFLAFLDADDAWDRNRLLRCHERIAAEPNADIVVTNGVFTLNGQVARRRYETFPERLLSDPRTAILERNRLFCPVVRSTVFREIGGFDESLRRVEDWDCWIRLILAGGKVSYIDETLVDYRYTEGSLSRDSVAMRRAELAVIEKTEGHPALTSTERDVLRETRGRILKSLNVDLAREALWQRDGSARRRCTSVVLDAGQPLALRVGFALAVLSPSLFRACRGKFRHVDGGFSARAAGLDTGGQQRGLTAANSQR